MKLKMLTAMAGAAVTWSVGDVVDVEDAEAARLIAAGFAAPAEAAPAVAVREKAAKSVTEVR